jgi:hypothetical protein
MATTTVTTRGTDPSRALAGQIVVVGNPGGHRVALFQEALAARGLAPAVIVPYADLLAGRATLEEFVTDGSVLRVESPDRDFEVERALIAAGADEQDEETGAARVGRAEALRLEFDRGRILYPRQWFLGFRGLLCQVERQRASCPPHAVMNRPTDISVMFDKPACHALFGDHGVPCPLGLGTPRGYDDLRERMARAGVRRVFVKLAQGSSASGIAALETDGRRVQATTTVEAIDAGGGLRLYNTRAIRRSTDERLVASVIDALCKERAHAEQWVPKASLPGGAFDLRVVVIGGRAMHAVARVSGGPMTNLHLRNRRADPGLVRTRMSPQAWEAALRSCERAAGVVPDSLYAGVDVVIAPGFRRHAVLEMNAFGDLLPCVTFEGMDTYTAELAALGVTAGGGAP